MLREGRECYRGVDLLSVQKLGGWRTLSMVLRYAHLASDHLRPAVERLSGLNLGLGPAGAISRTA